MAYLNWRNKYLSVKERIRLRCIELLGDKEYRRKLEEERNRQPILMEYLANVKEIAKQEVHDESTTRRMAKKVS